MIKEACREIIVYAVQDSPKFSKKDFEVLKIRISKKHKLGTVLKNAQILEHAKDPELEILKKFFSRKPTRSISGVSIVSVMTSPELKCPHGVCTYCPRGENAAQSYTGKEPASRRAKLNDYNPFKQVTNRLSQLKKIGHPIDKIELIVQGGTFCSHPFEYQENFIKSCLEAVVGKTFSAFSELKAASEVSKSRPVGITIETKPDFCKEQHINKILELGVTRVELGVQTIYEDILNSVNRGHTLKDTIEATQLLKDSGLKVCYHMMPGLPGSNYEKDLHALKEIFENPDFKPDMLKIYPTLVIKGTALYGQWENNLYTPLSSEQAAEIIVQAKKFFPKYVRVMRINRDIPSTEIAAGVLRTDLRELVKERQKQLGIKCQCIRCREVGHRFRKEKISPENIEIREFSYGASGGKEIFISAEDFEKEILIGYLRLRFPSQREGERRAHPLNWRVDASQSEDGRRAHAPNLVVDVFKHPRFVTKLPPFVPEKVFRPEITPDTALIRELHICGPEVPIGETAKESAYQHKGFGKKLLARAEEISKENGFKKLLVLSGIGAKEYYKKLGYDYNGIYMGKML